MFVQFISIVLKNDFRIEDSGFGFLYMTHSARKWKRDSRCTEDFQGKVSNLVFTFNYRSLK